MVDIRIRVSSSIIGDNRACLLEEILPNLSANIDMKEADILLS